MPQHEEAAVYELPSEMTIDQAILLATRLHRLEKLDDAEMLYRRILDAAPDHPDALNFLGVLIHQRGDSTGAIALIERSIAIDPSLPDRFANLGNILAESGRAEEAVAAYRKAIAIAPAQSQVLANAWNNLGAVLRMQTRLEEAAQAYENAIATKPGHVDAYNNYGNLLAGQGQTERAVAYYCKALTVSPGHGVSRKLLGMAYYMLGQIKEAAAVYQAWLADEPEHPIALHMLAACSGESVPARASDDYIKRTFDGFAASFDAKLEQLAYRAPQLVADAVHKVWPSAARLQALDAGCGTGLCGTLIKPWCAHLTGVDLSAGMLDRAKHLDIYDQLILGELTAYLDANPATFDLIVSADTLVYFGPLESVMQAARRALLPGGLMAFTVEALVDKGTATPYRINPHGRYSHDREYLKRIIADSELRLMNLEDAVLRKEGGAPVNGYVVTCSREHV